MRLSTRNLLAVLTAAAVLAFSMPATSSDFQPARFGTGPYSFLANLQCPDRPDDPIDGTVFCEAQIKTDGRPELLNSHCFVPGRRNRKLEAFRFEANRAMEKSIFVPAMVDGENVEVAFIFRVAFFWKSDTCDAFAIPNSGEEGITDVLNYFAPQEIRSHGRSWFDRTFYSTSGEDFSGSGIRFAISVQVAEDGYPSDPRVEVNHSVRAQKVRESLRSIVHSKFIPGFYGGKPTTMRHYAIVVSY